MSQNLVVNGRRYIPSADLARRFGYTSDYVSRLAREKKIVATNINRKWFISEDSFGEFISTSALGKEIRNTELQKQRKVERLLHAKKNEKVNSSTHIALAQSMAVFMCGIFLGLLGWTTVGNDIDLQDIAYGVEESYAQIAEAVFPRNSSLHIFSQRSVATVFQEQIIPDAPSYTEEKSDGAFSAPIADSKNSDVMKFSDEVDITYQEDGFGVVRPIFKNNTDSQEYRMVLDPVE